MCMWGIASAVLMVLANGILVLINLQPHMTYHKTQFRQNADLRNIANRRAEAAYSIATAVMIGLALAGLAVAWGLSV